MNAITPIRREFLFLQGPPGPFFRLLADALREHGLGVHRINLSGGDRYDWPHGSTDYRGTQRGWPMAFDRFVRSNGITDLVVYGDCRPMHKVALRMAQLRGIHIHVFEEGYIRPDWMTLERDGVNGHSPLPRDPSLIEAAARWLPPIPDLPPITSAFKRRARDSYWHYHHVVTGKLRFPFYTSHRQGSITMDGIRWLMKFARRKRRARQAEATLAQIAGRKFFLFPLQLTGDYQIRAHSPFGSMPVAVDYVLESFAAFAPADTLLLVKEHPLDSGKRNWRAYLERRCARLGVCDRVLHLDGGDLQSLSKTAQGMVCVNSTSGTLALEAGLPVAVLGDAVYDLPGVTHQGGLDLFWTAPEVPDRKLYAAFKKVLHASCLVRGGLASASGVRILVRNSVERLLADPETAVRDMRKVPVRRAARQAEGTSPASAR
ncbi:capsule biosynthesis protein [Novosphingobium sp. FKTRR1]|uniref:capsule biosynthesis protein n=1 Tax=Novosphingobium sp. FKTRR1 TaxID=2879118 RepID=UPI001CF00AEB|nr:capsular biosynthesis protein [Novosphingobium sp. FKTRR1]